MSNIEIERGQAVRANSGWNIDLKAALCEQCDWRFLLPEDHLPLRCPHCFQTELTRLSEPDNGPGPTGHPPELLVPFSVDSQKVRQSISDFTSGAWFAPADMKPELLTNRLQRLYLPMWLVDSEVQAIWQAEAGYDYEAVSHREQFDENRGGWTSRQVTETRIRWEPRVGRLSRTYHNVPAPALEEHFDLSRQLGEYDLEASQAYSAEAVQKALVRTPNRNPDDSWPDALPVFQANASAECRQASSADHMREFRWTADFAGQNWTLLLLPLYSTYYLDDEKKPQPVLIHGQTGRVSGPRRASMKRAQQVALIILAVAAVIFFISLVVALAAVLMPPLLVLGAAGLVLAIVIGMMAVVPIVIVWQSNRTP